MKSKHLISLIVIAFIAVGIWWVVDSNAPTASDTVLSFQECVDAGNPVMESYPRQCRADGETFTEDIGNELEKRDLIRIESPRPNQTVSSTFTIRGEARGTWYFEADFPIDIEDGSGTVVTTTIATAQGEWMTEDFVPFTSTVTVPASLSGNGNLFLRKDNPSGLPENDDFLRVPIRFE